MPSTRSPRAATTEKSALSESIRPHRPARLNFRGFGWRPVGRRRAAVRDIDLRIEPGERVLLAGPSGAGKSTLLRAAAGVLESAGGGEQAGEVTVDGPAGLLLQNPSDAIVSDRVGRDVAFGPENAGVDRDDIWVRVRQSLELVGFPYDASTPTRTLSGGETQRLALAGALALRPGLLLLDEPTSMLDDDAAAEIRDAVLSVVSATGATLIVAGHRIGGWLEHVDRLVVLGSDGTLLCDARPTAALERYESDLAAAGLWLPGLPPPDAVPVPLGDPEFWREKHPSGAGGGVSHAKTRVPDADPMVEAVGLGVRLRRRSLTGWRESDAVVDVDVSVPAASATCLSGRSGAGKSTLLAALGGLLSPTRGEVRASPTLAAGLATAPNRWRSPDLATRVGWVPQDPEHGFVRHRVRDEVATTAQRLGRKVGAVGAGGGADVAGRTVGIEALLDAFGLARLADANPYQLSGGEQRRLALLAGLAHVPRLALLDEPTVGQDRHTWGAIAGIVSSLVDRGSGVAIATHDRALSALADAEIVIDQGRVVTRR